MTTTVEQVALVTREATPLQSLAAQINEAHKEACASVRTALGHAARAGDFLLRRSGNWGTVRGSRGYASTVPMCRNEEGERNLVGN